MQIYGVHQILKLSELVIKAQDDGQLPAQPSEKQVLDYSAYVLDNQGDFDTETIDQAQVVFDALNPVPDPGEDSG